MALLIGGGGGVLVLTTVFSILSSSDARLSTPLQLAISAVILYGSLCLAGWLVCLKRRDGTLADAGLDWVGWGPVLLMLPGTIGLLVVNAAVFAATDLVIDNVPTAQDQVLGEQNVLPASDLVWLILVAVVIAPVAEEFLLRGLLYRYVRAARGVLVAMVVSSLVWAVAHFYPQLIVAFIVFGMIEAFVAERYKSLYPAIVLHGLYNGVLVIGLYQTLNP
jgi:membrane protease YdiL (CAAX protease family)